MRFQKHIIALVIGTVLTGCSLEEKWYDAVVPETFFQTEGDVLAALYRPFTHARWYVTGARWDLQEYTADQFVISTKGRHWYNGGIFERFQHHQWTQDDGQIWDTWRGTLQGVALSLDVKNDLSQLDYPSLNLTEEDKAAHLAQLDALIAFFYLRGLDYFGGLPVFTSLEEENVPRSSDRETFQHIESLLQEAIAVLPEKNVGEPLEGSMTKGAAAVLLARLYFNAEAYIGEAMYEEAGALAQEILDGNYGSYTLDPDWKDPHDFDNNTATGVIWSMPSEFNRLQYDWFFANYYHYNSRIYFDIDRGANNGTHLQPSRKPDGTLYDSFRLGKPYEKFEDQDLRKQPYEYLGGGNYQGMFLVGPQISPINGQPVLGNEEYNGELIEFVDYVGRMSEVGSTYASAADLPSNISQGEENTGIRLVKVPIPSQQDLNLRWGADHPVLRLAEVYYMLAEVKLRTGDPAAAADLINTVRARAFENGNDPNPVTADNLDFYRMADEWGIEFLGEGRRRTDLIRLGFFTTEDWWDHQASGSDHLKRFPVPTPALSGSSALEQNPGYN